MINLTQLRIKRKRALIVSVIIISLLLIMILTFFFLLVSSSKINNVRVFSNEGEIQIEWDKDGFSPFINVRIFIQGDGVKISSRRMIANKYQYLQL